MRASPAKADSGCLAHPLQKGTHERKLAHAVEGGIWVRAKDLTNTEAAKTLAGGKGAQWSFFLQRFLKEGITGPPLPSLVGRGEGL